MLQTFKNGQGSIIVRAKLLDSSSTTGAGLTGLTSASSGLIISTIADVEAAATAYTVAGSTVEGITTLGTYAAPTATKCRFKEVDATNHKGVYEFQFADARFAVSNAKSLLVSVLGATNLQQADFLIQLQTDDPYIAKPANFNLASIDSNGRVDAIKIAGTTQTAGDIIGKLGTPAGASVSADIAAAKSDTAAIKAKTDNLPSDPADASDIAASFTTVNGTLSTIAAYIDTEVAAIKAKTDNLPSDPADASDIAASFTSLNTLLTVTGIVLTASERTAIAAAIGGRTITEGYRSNGAAPTLDEGISEILGHLGESSIVTTTKTVKKFDHSTTAATFTLNDATTPTSITRAS